MKCNKCNFENNNESKFCINRGNELVSNNRSMKNEQIMDTNRQKKRCKTIGIIGLITSFIIGILSLPLNIIAIVNGSKIKKSTGKTETGFILGIIGIIISIIVVFLQVCLITAVLNFTREIKKIFTTIDNNAIVEILQDNNIINKNIELIDTVTEINAGVIPYRYTYYIYQEDSGNIIAVYYKTNTITKDNFTIEIYSDVVVDENIKYIYGDTGKYELFYIYKDGNVSEMNKYGFGNSKTYTIIKNDKGYLVKEEN